MSVTPPTPAPVVDAENFLKEAAKDAVVFGTSLGAVLAILVNTVSQVHLPAQYTAVLVGVSTVVAGVTSWIRRQVTASNKGA